jgi:uncharacterized protein YpmS
MINEHNTLIGIWIILIIILIIVVVIIGMLINISRQSWKSEGHDFYKSKDFDKRYGFNEDDF